MRYLVSILCILALYSCTREEVNGILIGHNLYDTQSPDFNRTLCALIEKTLQKEPQALNGLIHVECGGAAGCYDLGDVIVQIIARVGEGDFIKMAGSLNAADKAELKAFIDVGIEYGRVENLESLEKAFPELNKLLTVK